MPSLSSFRARLRALLIAVLAIGLVTIPVSFALERDAERDLGDAQRAIRGLDRLTFLSSTINSVRRPARAYALNPSEYSRKVLDDSVGAIRESAGATSISNARDRKRVDIAVTRIERARDRLVRESDAGKSPLDVLFAFENVLNAEVEEVVGDVTVARAEAGIAAQSRLDDSLRSKLRLVQLVAIAGGVTLVLGAWLLPILLSRRLEQLERATRDIASGSYSGSFGAYGNDEIGRLARSFQAMSVALQLRDSENLFLLDAQIERATRDSLTGLRNNRFFHETLDALLTTTRQTVTVSVFDLDNFKSVNDTYGHAEGDEVLRRVARAMEQCIRRTDVACRLGGEEFAIIFPASEVDDCVRVMSSIAEALLATDPEGRRTTFSCGVASAAEGSAQDLFERADMGAYDAKKAGKDQIVRVPQPA